MLSIVRESKIHHLVMLPVSSGALVSPALCGILQPLVISELEHCDVLARYKFVEFSQPASSPVGRLVFLNMVPLVFIMYKVLSLHQVSRIP